MRLAYLVGFLCCAGLLGYGYYLQYYQYLDPCPLCMVQRLGFYGMGIFFLLGALVGRARKTWASLVTVFGLLGIVSAGRHLWLQSLPKSEVPDSCGAGLDYMLQTLPLREVLESLVTGAGECAEVSWSFLGLSMPGWALVWFVLMTLGAWVFVLMRRRA